MAKKRRRGRKTKGPSERSQELDRLLDGHDGFSDEEEFRRRLSRALGGFPGWLPHLVKRTSKGPAARRKAAVTVLALSHTDAGREKLIACLTHSGSPAWLRRHALTLAGSLVPAEEALGIERDLDVSDRDALLGRAARGDRSAIELLIDEGEEEHLAELLDQDPRLAELVCDCLLDYQSATAARILRLASRQSGCSSRSKLIRKTAHVLRQRGVAVSLETEAGETEAGEMGKRGVGNRLQQRAFVGPIGPSGERFVVVSVERLGDSARDVLYAVIRDREGLAVFEHGAMSVRQERELLAIWRDEHPEMGFQEVLPEWAWEVLRRAYARSREAACRVPEEFVLCRHQWELQGSGDGTEMTAGFDLPGDVSAREMAALAESYPMKTWELEQDLVEECRLGLEEVESSPLTLGLEVSRERRDRVFAESVEQIFDDDRRLFVRQRLDETARFLAASGRRHEAVVALAAAELMKNGSSVAENPFCLALLRSRVEALPKRDESEASLIERPGSVDLPQGNLSS